MTLDPNKPLVDPFEQQQRSKLVEPDAETKERIANLAIVGEALNETYGEENMDYGTDFFLAKEGLLKFKSGIERLNLDPRSRKGMMDLIDYLMKKIDKRMNRTGDMSTKMS
ncbi:MAG: hypothetical protein TR69_WS6001000737 [candidate division WS6 bacterium OLB20]|uniref:Uncharacterized protein n=1 Tax=candidate division WS6 bacterium OLB20 TaxID=1617426 RepID=A0A136LYK1_9BACT|nr:MAG: hypothetical protein TR69_WS6001000737 [candidate division WS6 bacterium OLB20]